MIFLLFLKEALCSPRLHLSCKSPNLKQLKLVQQFKIIGLYFNKSLQAAFAHKMYLTKLTSEAAYRLNDLQQNKGSFGYN